MLATLQPVESRSLVPCHCGTYDSTTIYETDPLNIYLSIGNSYLKCSKMVAQDVFVYSPFSARVAYKYHFDERKVPESREVSQSHTTLSKSLLGLLRKQRPAQLRITTSNDCILWQTWYRLSLKNVYSSLYPENILTGTSLDLIA
uniref:Uncharacterized protein n=1 Tax=Rhodnius prolixus TaxID=13249 RepID=T1IBB1_RHOPR